MDPRVFDVARFGAKTDGSMDSTAALQAAIDAAAKLARSVVRIAAGATVVSRAVALRSGMVLEIDGRLRSAHGDAVLKSWPTLPALPTYGRDRDGAKRLIDLSVANGVRRFVMLSSVGAANPDPDSELAHYLQAKHEADEHLKATDLEYAILRPVSLTDADGTGEVRLGENVDPKGEAARGDVAKLLADAAEAPEWVGKVLTMESVG